MNLEVFLQQAHHFRHGRPMLLDQDGRVVELVSGPLDHPHGFHPTAKWDPVRDEVAWATVRGDTTTLTVYDRTATPFTFVPFEL